MKGELERFQQAVDRDLSERLAGLPSSRRGRIAVISLDAEGDVRQRPWQKVASRRVEASSDWELDLSSAVRQQVETPDGPLWVAGDSVLCRCPDCLAPMAMRVGVGMAGCWQCEASVELTEAQRDAVARHRLGTGSGGSGVVSEPRGERGGGSRRAVHAEVDEASAWQAAVRRPGRRTRFRRFRDRFNAFPAWLVSLLVHLLVLLLLALILLPPEHWQQITLTTFLDSADEVGGEIRIVDPDHWLQDDLLPEPLLELSDRELRAARRLADEDARELLLEDPSLAQRDVAEVRRNITTHRGRTLSLAARDPRVRSEVVEREGGSTWTEAAVSRGLRWLASVQNADGSWSLTRYERSDQASNPGDAAATSLALLPFLGAGQTHESGVYKSTVARGLQWLLKYQGSDGSLWFGTNRQQQMYGHGQAAIVLVEAYAMTGDQKLREPAERAIRFIERAQHRRGGWRYEPGEEGDTSVLGWQLMALQSAAASGSGIAVDQDTLRLADYYLDLVSRRPSLNEMARGGMDERYRLEGVLYRYQPSNPPTPAMTAEALLCRMYLGWPKDDSRLVLGVDYLSQHHLPDPDDGMNVYYWYYATQAMHHYGGSVWRRWNQKVQDVLLAAQETRGEYPGSWDPDRDEWGSRGGGRIFVTSLAVCILEVYYRHLPLFKQLNLEPEAR